MAAVRIPWLNAAGEAGRDGGRGLEGAILHELLSRGGLAVLALSAAGVQYISAGLRDLLGLPAGAEASIPYDRILSPVAEQRLQLALRNRESGPFPVRFRRAAPEVPSEGDSWCTLSMSARILSLEGQPLLLLYALPTGPSQPTRGEGEGIGQNSEDFMAMLSHEIRTPVTSLLGFLSLLEGTPLNQEQGNYVEAMQGLASSIHGLLSDTLDEFRLRAGALALHYEYFDLRAALAGLLRQYRMQHGHLQMSFDYALSVPDVVRGDGHRVIQMVTNLLTNAIKYTTRGGVHLRVFTLEDVAEGEGKGMVAIAVKDSGIGIPEAERERIFKAFTQVGDSSRQQGFGLGLHITRQLVALHGGHVLLQSREHEGTEITLVLPLLQDWDEAEAAAARARIEASAGKPAPRREGIGAAPRMVRPSAPPSTPAKEAVGEPPIARVLLVDDNAMNILVEKKFFDRWGYPVDTARSGEEALALVRDKSYSLIFMDLRMPGLDGYETTECIRALPGPRGSVPIIALTASTEQGVKTRIFECGMQGYIFKPFDARELREHLERYVGAPPGSAGEG